MRLIDADVLLERLDKLIKDEWNDKTYTTWANAFEDAAFLVETALTIEAKPVVHAHWQKYDDSEFCYCSHCGKPAAEDDDVSWHGYCPVCGATMDEVVSE